MQNHNTNPLPDEALVSVKTVAKLYESGISTIWARVKRKELPAPVKIGRSTRWRLGEIRAAMQSAVKP